MKKRHDTKAVIAGIAVAILMLGFSSALSAEPSSVLILPFDILSEKDLSYLQLSVANMFSTRLADEEQLSALAPAETQQTLGEKAGVVDLQKALSWGEKRHADYVVFGSISVLGRSISTDARFVDVHRKKPLITFTRSGSKIDDVIGHIDSFTQQIKEKISLPGTGIHAADVETQADRTLEASSMTSRRTVSGGTSGPDSGEPFAIRRIRNFDEQINGLVLGDVDGDGRNETVYIGRKGVAVYRYADGHFRAFKEVKSKRRQNPVWVDLADTNGNGIPEIFITSRLRNQMVPNSYVLEWDGAGFNTLVENVRWFFRVIDDPSKGRILVGQRHGQKKVFKNGVYALTWRNGRIEASQKLNLPKGVGLYDFVYGDVLNDGREYILAISSDGYLRLLNSDGNKEWGSTVRYGGSPIFLEYTSPMGQEDKNVLYMKQRMKVTDIDGDGRNEVIVVENDDASRRIFQGLRIFKSGRVSCLVSENAGLKPKWKTPAYSKFVSACTVGDVDNDGREEVVFAVLAESGGLFSDNSSYIAVLDVAPPGE